MPKTKKKNVRAAKKPARAPWAERAVKKLRQFEALVAKWEPTVAGTAAHEHVAGLHSVVTLTADAFGALGADFIPRGKKHDWTQGDKVQVKSERATLYPEAVGIGEVAEVHRTRNGRGAQVRLRVGFEVGGPENVGVMQFVVGSAADFTRAASL